MPTSHLSPGVFVEEVPSRNRSISGVPTSITAFIGRAQRGPVNKAILINSYADYERIFGGLDLNSAMSFAVRDFYLNGGSQAIIGRLYEVNPDGASLATIAVDNLFLVAASEGAWANNLRVRVEHEVSPAVAAEQGLTQADLFNITIQDTATGVQEHYANVSVVDGSRRIDQILLNESILLNVQNPDALPDTTPAESAAPVLGNDPFSINNPQTNYLVTTQAVDSSALTINSYTATGNSASNQGLYLLKQAELFNLLCLPVEGSGDYPIGLLAAATTLCEQERAMLLIDPPSSWTDESHALADIDLYVGSRSENTAIFFPRLKQANPLHDNATQDFAPCGAIAGIISRTDTQRGVWKAAAGKEATVRGISGLSINLNDDQNGKLNRNGINCLRTLAVIGNVVWGSRTLQGADSLASEWKYIPVKRTALYIEQSLIRGLEWIAFESNNESLWAHIQLSVNNFMNSLFRQGAFQGSKQSEAYFVKCDKNTVTQNDIEHGMVNIILGFAPLKPAEFVIIKLQLNAGQS